MWNPRVPPLRPMRRVPRAGGELTQALDLQVESFDPGILAFVKGKGWVKELRSWSLTEFDESASAARIL